MQTNRIGKFIREPMRFETIVAIDEIIRNNVDIQDWYYELVRQDIERQIEEDYED